MRYVQTNIWQTETAVGDDGRFGFCFFRMFYPSIAAAAARSPAIFPEMKIHTGTDCPETGDRFGRLNHGFNDSFSSSMLLSVHQQGTTWFS